MESGLATLDLRNGDHSHRFGRPDFIDYIAHAAMEDGIIAVRQNILSTTLRKQLLQEAGRFFERPLSEKTDYVGSSATSIGFSARENGKYRSDNAVGDFVYEMIDVVSPRIHYPHFDSSVFPTEMSSFSDTVKAYYEANVKIEEIISTLFSLVLSQIAGVPLGEHYLRDMIAPHRGLLRINHYPAPASGKYTEEQTMERNGAHVDWTPFTVLQPYGPGLEVFRADEWQSVPFDDEILLVLIGEQLVRLSNGRFKGCLHRVPASTDARVDRFSTAYFVSEELVPGPERYWQPLCRAGETTHFDPCTIWQFLTAKFSDKKSG